MPGLGEYCDRIVILTRSLADPDQFGERVESWTETGSAWARVEAPGGGEQPTTLRQAVATVRLRFRGVVAVEAVDRVQIAGDVYAVIGVWRERSESGGWQTVCSCVGVY